MVPMLELLFWYDIYGYGLELLFWYDNYGYGLELLFWYDNYGYGFLHECFGKYLPHKTKRRKHVKVHLLPY